MRIELTDGDFWDVSGDAACILDGCYGWHNLYRIVELAVTHGMKLSDDDMAAVGAFKAGETCDDSDECIHELAEEAEQHLNEQLLTPGWQFGWSESEFFLANGAWWNKQP